MKKIRFMVAICAALMIAAPAMALEVEVSGHYFIEYFNNSNPNFKDSDATDDYVTMEFMAKPVFKVNDNITLTTQFTALRITYGAPMPAARTMKPPATRWTRNGQQ